MYVPRHGNTHSVRSRMLAFGRCRFAVGTRFNRHRNINDRQIDILIVARSSDRSLFHVSNVCLIFISLSRAMAREKYSPTGRDLIDSTRSISDLSTKKKKTLLRKRSLNFERQFFPFLSWNFSHYSWELCHNLVVQSARYFWTV